MTYPGSFRFPPKDAFILSSLEDPLPDPHWYHIYEREPGDTDGEVLASFQLIPKNSATEGVPGRIPSIRPEYRV